MKKIFLFLFLILLAPMSVKADDHIYMVDMEIYLYEDGNAHVTEIWDVQSDEKNKEWCKLFVNLENLKIKNVNILKDEQIGQSEDEINLEEKSNRYEFNDVSGGSQLCFGYEDTERHKFMLEYTIEDYVINTEDAQVLYHVLAENVTADIFYSEIVTYYKLPDNLEIRGLGYEGSSYVDGGKIVLANFDGIKDQYIATLVKFPKNTFTTTKTDTQFNTFKDALKHAENKAYEYNGDYKKKFRFTFVDFIFVLLSIFVIVLIAEFIVRRVTGKSILKQEKIEKLLDKIIPFVKKIFGKIGRFCKNVFEKIKEVLIKVIKFIKNKIGKKKDNNM